MDKQFAQNLRKLRIRAGLTQIQVAQKLGVAPSSYSCYESGKREPDIDKLKMIADILGVSGNELLRMDENGNEIGITETLTNDEDEMLDKYRAIPMEKRHYIDLFIDAIYKEVAP